MSLILTLNAGSSSIKFAVFRAGAPPERLAAGMVDRIGAERALLRLRHDSGTHDTQIGKVDHAGALLAILQALDPVLEGAPVTGIGHRIVHGGPIFDGPALLDANALTALRALEPFAPLHQPHNLFAITAAQAAFPGARQVGCFDTAFHCGQPWVADTFALPRRYHDAGIRRYGFHGLSYSYVSGELALIDPKAAQGRTIIAHLGNGASVCALDAGRPMGSSMGFSPLDGLPMGTRCGQIDPAVLLYMMQQEGMVAGDISRLLYHESGLLGLSGLSNDMRELEAAGTAEAQQAIDYFVHRLRREIGAMAAVLGGLDTLVFCGGIGEHSAMIRAGACDGMGWIGIELDSERNAAGQGLISAGPVSVRVIPTDEEIVIAREVVPFLG